MALLMRLLLLCCPLTLAAQQPLQYTRLTAENGLSNNSVRCILQDRTGLVWIGTHGGLNRYDGATFYPYSNLSTPALTNSVITVLTEDADGYVWIGTENGLNILHPSTNSITQFIHDNLQPASLPAGVIRGLQPMADGSIWVLSDRWVARFSNRKVFTLVSIDPALVQSDMVLAGLTPQGKEEVWISYLDQPTTLARRTIVDGREQLQQALYKAPDYAKVYVDANGASWGISCTGVNRFNTTTRRFEPWLENEYAPRSPNLHIYTCLCSDADGNVWQGSDRASLVKYDLQQKKAINYSGLLTSSNATIAYCVYKDHSNNIWVGTDNGIVKISNRASIFSNIPLALRGTVLTNIRCRRIVADKYQALYAGTENYGLLKRKRLPNGTDTTIALSTFGTTPVSVFSFEKNRVALKLDGRYDLGYTYDMWYDGDNTIWLAGFGIGKLDIRTDSLVIFLTGPDDQRRRESINQLAICFDGHLFWTAGQNNLFNFDPKTERMTPFVDALGKMPFYNLPCWSLVHSGDWIWAGTSKGLYRINSRTHEVVAKKIHPVLEFGINDICLDADSSLWISTMGGGIVHYNERSGQVHQYTNKDGLNNNTVCGMLRDDNNNLWISTYAGLSYFDRKTTQFTSFYAKDGLNTDEFNRKAFTRLSDGRMIFGGLNGYTVFNPAEAFKRDKPVRILLTRFSKTGNDGNVVDTMFNGNTLDEVIIKPGDRFFAFHFTLTDMYDPAGNRYRYRLEGLDNDWHPIGNQPFVSFNSLPHGQYTLHIKGSPGKGAESTNELVIKLVVQQAFYRSVWFMLLVVLAGGVIVLGIIQYRIRQLRKIQGLRTRIASDLHDEVGSSLVHITMLADQVKRAGGKVGMEEQLAGIAGISRGAVSTMKDIIWSIDARYDTMEGMISHMRDHMYSVLGPADIEFELLQEGLNGPEKLPADFRQQVYLIFKEAINNVVKHSKATRVQISLQREAGFLTMEIKDNGRGIDPDNHSSGQGVSNMKMRAGRLGATMEIVSQQGVTVKLKAPL